MPSSPRSALPWLAFGALTVVFTWPISNLAEPQLPLHDDALFSVWRLAWVAHQLVAAPADLFHGNIFTPEPNTLAFSDAMLVLGVLGAPLIWAGVHPLVVHNLLLLASFLAAAYGAMRLLAYFGADRPSQAIGALIFAFAPYRVAHIGHLELLWTAFMPLALWCLYRVLEEPTWRRGLAFGVVIALQGFSSIYYLVFLVIWLVPATVIARWHIPFVWSRQHLAAGLIAVVTAGALLGPYAAVYADAREGLGARDISELRRYSAVPSDYVNAPKANWLYAARPTESPDERSLFMGVVPVALAVFALWYRRTVDAIPLAVLALIAFDLSLGVNGVSFSVLRRLAPALDSFRAPARVAVLALLAVSALAAMALTTLRGRLRGDWPRRVATASIATLILVEFWSAPMPTMTMPLRAPEAYRWLAGQPPSVVLELPTPVPDALWKYETTYQYFSIYHWQRLVNGYSGHAPRSYVRLLDSVRDFPSDRALDFLRNRRVDFVVLHERLMAPGEFARLLLACADERRFSEVRVFDDPELRRIVICRPARIAQISR